MSARSRACRAAFDGQIGRLLASARDSAGSRTPVSRSTRPLLICSPVASKILRLMSAVATTCSGIALPTLAMAVRTGNAMLLGTRPVRKGPRPDRSQAPRPMGSSSAPSAGLVYDTRSKDIYQARHYNRLSAVVSACKRLYAKIYQNTISIPHIGIATTPTPYAANRE